MSLHSRVQASLAAQPESLVEQQPLRCDAEILGVFARKSQLLTTENCRTIRNRDVT